MPYRHAHWLVLALFPLTILAFWPSYFGKLGEAAVSDHLHGLTGAAWLLLVAGQSWTIHGGRRGMHRVMGMSAFALGPLLIGGFALATHAGAIKSVASHPFYMMFGQPLLTADLWLTFATSAVLYLAFRYRRRVRLHSALMLSTLIGLLPPMLARLYAAFMPGMTVRGPETLYRFEYCLAASMATTVAVALYLYWKNRRDGWPWLLAAFITSACYAFYMTIGRTGTWESFVVQMANWPAPAVVLAGIALGLAGCLAGWHAGKTRKAIASAEPVGRSLASARAGDRSLGT
ncbi:MAG: hypothetical protein QNJ40_05680 [Xanthomonadales bacterium]|nr:hypothetical protein [Xanthomonadales bacterium]